MLNKLPITKKHLLIIGTIVLLFASYRLAFKPTLDAWQLNQDLQLQAKGNLNSITMGYLERKHTNINQILQLYQVDTLTFRSKIINGISLIAEKENVKLVEIPSQDVNYSSANTIIQKINFEGDYFALIRLLNQIEQTNGIGIVRSVGWHRFELHAGSSMAIRLRLELFLIIEK